MRREMPRLQSKPSSSLLPMLALAFLFAPVQQALASSSYAGVSLWEPFISNTTADDFQTNSATPASATLLGVTGGARSELSTGSLGAGLELSPVSPFGFYGSEAGWNDVWPGGTYFGPVPVAANITLHGSISTTALTFTDAFFELKFEYNIGSERILQFNASADSGPTEFRADVLGIDISSSIVFTPSPVNPLLTDFSLSYTQTVGVSSSGFNDWMSVAINVDGAGPLTLDAFSTFHVDLVSLDPNVTFTSEGGRTVAAVPEPATFAMLLGGLGLLGVAARRER